LLFGRKYVVLWHQTKRGCSKILSVRSAGNVSLLQVGILFFATPSSILSTFYYPLSQIHGKAGFQYTPERFSLIRLLCTPIKKPLHTAVRTPAYRPSQQMR